MVNYLKGTPEEGLEFKPRSYVCRRTFMKPEIDGRLDKPFWENAPWSDEFEDIEWNSKRPKPYHRTRMKMLWDDEFLYIGAYLEEDKLWGTLTERDSVIFNDNDFEIFIDPDGDTHAYYEFEINALNTVWDLLLIKPYRDANNGPCAVNGWDISGMKTAVHIDGVINNPSAVEDNKGWSVEIAMPWKILKECAAGGKKPEVHDYWRIDFSRVEWRTEIKNGKYSKVIDTETGRSYPEDNWIWSPIGLVNMHYPELWGFVYFTDCENDVFVIPEDEKLKWELRKVYYMEKNYYRQRGRYCTDYSELCGGEVGIINPVIEVTTSMYEAYVMTTDGKGRIVIRQDGCCRIER